MTLAHLRRGSGEPVLLIHGLGSLKEVWDPILDELARSRDVIAVDLPGFGDTPPINRTDLRSLIGSVEAFLDELGLDRVHVAGNSMGGGIALELARRGRASRVTAFAPIGFWTTPERIWGQQILATGRAVGRLGGGLLRTRADSIAMLPLFAAFYGRPTRLSAERRLVDFAGLATCPGFEAASRSFADYRFTDGAELADVPVTVAWGTRDLILPYPIHPHRARAALPTATHIELRGLGHIPFNDDPALCVSVLLDPAGHAGT